MDFLRTLTQRLETILLFSSLLAGPAPLCLFAIRRYLPNERAEGAHTFCMLLAGWSAGNILLALVLGALGRLVPGAVLTAELLLFAAGSLLWVASRRHKRTSASQQPIVNSHRAGRVGGLILLILLLAGAQLLWNVASTPITDFDSLYYHLPVMANMYQTGTLERIPVLGQNSFYPYHWELLSTLFLIPFQNDFLVAFPNTIAWILLGLAVYCASIELGARRTPALASAGIVLVMPLVFSNVNTLMIDLAFAAFFLTGTYAALIYHRTRSTAYLVVFLASLMVLIGIKMSGPGYALLLTLPLLIFEVTRYLRLYKFRLPPIRRPRWSRLLAMLLGGALMLFLGGYWYLENIIQIGNPLGYVEVKAAGFTIFQGNTNFIAFLQNSYPRVAEMTDFPLTKDSDLSTFNDFARKGTLANLFRFTERKHWSILAKELARYGHFPLLFLAILGTIAVGCAIWRPSKEVHRIPVLWLCVLLAGAWILYWHTPFSADNGDNAWQVTPWLGQALRYALPFFGLLGILASLGATWAGLPDSVSLFLFAAWGGFSLGKTFFPAIAAALLAGWLVYRWLAVPRASLARISRLPRALTVGFLLLVLAGMVVYASPIAYRQREARKAQIFGEVQNYIQRNVEPHETIAYVLSFRPYLLYGKYLDRKALNEPSRPGDDLPAWLAELEASRVRLVAMGPVWDEFWKDTQEYTWLEAPNGPFTRVFGQDILSEVVLYQIKGAPAP